MDCTDAELSGNFTLDWPLFHTFIHQWEAPPAPLEAIRVQCLAQGHYSLQTGATLQLSPCSLLYRLSHGGPGVANRCLQPVGCYGLRKAPEENPDSILQSCHSCHTGSTFMGTGEILRPQM